MLISNPQILLTQQLAKSYCRLWKHIFTSFRGYSIPLENAVNIVVSIAAAALWTIAVQVKRPDHLLYEIVGGDSADVLT
jgi:hypothetical protein